MLQICHISPLTEVRDQRLAHGDPEWLFFWLGSQNWSHLSNKMQQYCHKQENCFLSKAKSHSGEGNVPQPPLTHRRSHSTADNMGCIQATVKTPQLSSMCPCFDRHSKNNRLGVVLFPFSLNKAVIADEIADSTLT